MEDRPPPRRPGHHASTTRQRDGAARLRPIEASVGRSPSAGWLAPDGRGERHLRIVVRRCHARTTVVSVTDYDPTSVDVLIERCDVCGDVALRRTSLGERPLVNVRWRATKSIKCDHMVVEWLHVSS